MIRSRIIDKDHAQSADRWNFPSVDATAADALRGATTGGAHQLTAGQLDALQRQVREEAERRGYEEGLASGKAEIAARLARLTALVGAFTQPFQSLEQAVEDELVGLAVKLAAHLVRREIEHDPTLLQAAVHDCFAALAGSVRDVTVYLHPDDAALIRDQLAASAEQRFDIAVDAELARGDLRLGSSSSLVDGSIEVRCAEIIAAARNATSAAE
jgi:flagellar assembly protein FliH